jgi:hypothetical protein
VKQESGWLEAPIGEQTSFRPLKSGIGVSFSHRTEMSFQKELQMKKQILKSLAMVSLIGILTLVAAAQSAQAQSRTDYTANIPFAFNVGNETLPAGQYIITNARTVDGAVILRIRAKGHEGLMRLTNGVRANAPRQKTVLVFNRYGERSFLAEMWRAGESEGRQLPKSRSERAVERELARTPSQSKPSALLASTVEIAALAN